MTDKSDVEKAEPAAGTHGRIVVTGGIHARRDVIMGDQYNDFRQQVAQVVSAEEFVAQAQELQAILAEIKRQPELSPEQAETVEVVEGQVQQVIEEAGKPQPVVARITATLTGARAVMDSLGETVKSAVGLGAVLAGLADVALKVFGGG
jgi:hypothetical protein